MQSVVLIQVLQMTRNTHVPQESCIQSICSVLYDLQEAVGHIAHLMKPSCAESSDLLGNLHGAAAILNCWCSVFLVPSEALAMDGGHILVVTCVLAFTSLGQGNKVLSS